MAGLNCLRLENLDLKYSPSSSVGIVSGLLAGRSGNSGSTPGRSKRCLSSPEHPDRFWDSVSLLFSGYLDCAPGVNWPNHRLTSHLHIAPRLRTSETVTPLFLMPPWRAHGQFGLYIFRVWFLDRIYRQVLEVLFFIKGEELCDCLKHWTRTLIHVNSYLQGHLFRLNLLLKTHKC